MPNWFSMPERRWVNAPFGTPAGKNFTGWIFLKENFMSLMFRPGVIAHSTPDNSLAVWQSVKKVDWFSAYITVSDFLIYERKKFNQSVTQMPCVLTIGSTMENAILPDVSGLVPWIVMLDLGKGAFSVWTPTTTSGESCEISLSPTASLGVRMER